ncbi:MAG: hypothetical protein A2144_10130 [Chloroflexi bacterium RBG_16_50_9]|nr:MAG: hypothetical protein A2144_10130 [Chloroflexi bacterium RBG_16_50_9]
MLSMTTTMEPLTTSVRAIAETLGGGIKENSLLLIEGDARSGKSVLSQYIAYSVASAKGCSVAYYATDDKEDNLISSMDSMLLYVRHSRVTDRFRIYALGKVFRDGRDSLQLLRSDIFGLPERFKLVVVDSLSLIVKNLDTTTKLDFLQSCKETCDQKNRSIILTIDTYALEKNIRPRAYSLSDYYMKLSSLNTILAPGNIDSRDIKALEVTKLAGAECHVPPCIKFEIKPNVGIQILPLVQIRV